MAKTMRKEPGRPSPRPKAKPQKARKVEPWELAIRFVVGGAVSVAAALVARGTNEVFGGLFTAFPATLLASLTLIARHGDAEQASSDAAGAVIGGLAFIPCALVIWLTVQRIPAASSFTAGLACWAAASAILYLAATALLRPFDRKE